jgi:hypothetical protein
MKAKDMSHISSIHKVIELVLQPPRVALHELKISSQFSHGTLLLWVR